MNFLVLQRKPHQKTHVFQVFLRLETFCLGSPESGVPIKTLSWMDEKRTWQWGPIQQDRMTGRDTVWHERVKGGSSPVTPAGTDNLVSVSSFLCWTGFLFRISSTTRMTATQELINYYLFNCLHIHYCLLSFVMSIVYCKILEGRVYEFYSVLNTVLYSKRLLTEATLKRIVRSLYMISGILWSRPSTTMWNQKQGTNTRCKRNSIA